MRMHIFSIHKRMLACRNCFSFIDGTRVNGPLRATEELANEDLVEACRGTTRAFVEIVRRMQKGQLNKTVSSLGSVHQNRKNWRLQGLVRGFRINGPSRQTKS